MMTSNQGKDKKDRCIFINDNSRQSLQSEDLASPSIKNINYVPARASATYNGQALIKPIVNPIRKGRMPWIDQATIEEFNLSKKDEPKQIENQIDHVKTNKFKAANT